MPIIVNRRKFQIIKKLVSGAYLIRITENGKLIQDFPTTEDEAQGALRALVCSYAFDTCRRGTFRIITR